MQTKKHLRDIYVSSLMVQAEDTSKRTVDNYYFSIYFPYTKPGASELGLTYENRYIYLPPPAQLTLNVDENNFASTLGHEIGHVLGLGDPPKNSAGRHVGKGRPTGDYDPRGVTSYLEGDFGISDKNVEDIWQKVLRGLTIARENNPEKRERAFRKERVPQFMFLEESVGSTKSKYIGRTVTR